MVEIFVAGVKPKETIQYLSEDLLQKFSDIPLIDKYDIYQSLMNYWKSTMQDDVYQIAEEGWKVVLSIDEKKKTWDCDLLPKYLVINKFFHTGKEAIERLEADWQAINQQLAELEEVNGGEEGLLAEAKNEKDKLTNVSVQKRLKGVRGDKDYAEEIEVLEKYVEFPDADNDIGGKIKYAYADLDKKVAVRYKTLTIDEIKEIVVDDKWMFTIEKNVRAEVERISQRLSQRTPD